MELSLIFDCPLLQMNSTTINVDVYANALRLLMWSKIRIDTATQNSITTVFRCSPTEN